MNPHEHTQQDEHDNPLYCRSCGGYLGQAEEATPETVAFFNGWSYCPEHAEEMRRLAKLPITVEDVTAAILAEEQDTFNLVRR